MWKEMIKIANEQNLIPNSKRTKQELSENGRKGGIKARETKRRNKTFRELATIFLKEKIQSEELKSKMIALGIADEECTNKMALLFASWMQGVKGNIKAIEFIRDTIGEKEADKLEINQAPVIKIERPKENDKSL